jgi:tRNA U34 5-carboxymethylaminomethyl modifying GTPase MnmE/TrmE
METIIAQATPSGESAIAVIRVSEDKLKNRKTGKLPFRRK